MTTEELDELLRRVRMRGSSSHSYLLLSDEQRGAIARVLLPEINRKIEEAKAPE